MAVSMMGDYDRNLIMGPLHGKFGMTFTGPSNLLAIFSRPFHSSCAFVSRIVRCFGFPSYKCKQQQQRLNLGESSIWVFCSGAYDTDLADQANSR